jgi:hypothetical protein
MRKMRAEAGDVDLVDVWPPVELTLTGVSRDHALDWAEQRLIELKMCNLSFIRAMDTAEVDPSELEANFSKTFEFFGTADGYLTVALQMLRSGNCTAEQLPSLFKAVTMLATLLSEARKHMLSMMPDSLRRTVINTESEAKPCPEDVEEEMTAIGQIRFGRKGLAS